MPDFDVKRSQAAEKLLFLSFFYSPDLSAGSFRAAALVKALQDLPDRDLHIEVITTQPNRYQSFARQASSHESYEGLDIHRIALPESRGGLLGQGRTFLHFARAVWKLVHKRQYDLVFATSSRLMTALLGALIAGRKGASLYLDIRDIFVETLGGIFRSILWRPFIWGFAFLERWIIRRADKINLVSPGFLPYFKARYPEGRYSFFSNGVDAEFARRLDNEAGGESARTLQLVYAGNIGDGQGLHKVLPKLAEQLVGKAHFTVIGDGNRAAELKDALENLHIDNVVVLQPVDRDELIGYYTTADVLFLHLNDMPALKRVLPSKIFEYAATGKPILAGVAGYAAGFIKDEVTNASVFPPCDFMAALEGLALLNLESTDRCEFTERYARERIMQHMAEDIVGSRRYHGHQKL